MTAVTDEALVEREARPSAAAPLAAGKARVHAPGQSSPLNALFVAPYVLVYLALLVTPLFMGWWLSFREVDLLAGSSDYVGARNYAELFQDPIFRGAVWNTFRFVLYTTPAFVLRETERVGLQFLEMVGFRLTGNERVDRYFSPYIYYAFRKPAA